MTDRPIAKGVEDLLGEEERRALTGLEYLQANLRGELPAAPICTPMGYRLTAAEEGRVVFSGAPGFDHMNPKGAVHGGWYGVLLDSCMGCAVMSRLPAGTGFTTLEYKVNIIRAIPAGTSVDAIGICDHAGRSTGVATGQIVGADDGRLYATGSTTCLIVKGRF